MRTVNGLLCDGAAALRRVGITSPKTDARRILGHVLNVEPGRLAAMSDEPVADAVAATFVNMIDQRATFKPVAQIVGYRDFWKYRFRVSHDVLDPRPETECLIEQALAYPFERVLDLGTGSGAVLLTLLAECPDATGVGTDISVDALEVARGNGLGLDLADRFGLVQSDWYTGVTGRFDLIVCNPPYIAADEMAELQADVRNHEPHLALTDQGDGLGAYRKIVPDAANFLKPGGRLIVEIGPTQAADVQKMFTQAGLRDVDIVQDLGQRDRVVTGNNPR